MRIFYEILSLLHNNVVDPNNVMNLASDII